jgi:hypothetical protein
MLLPYMHNARRYSFALATLFFVILGTAAFSGCLPNSPNAVISASTTQAKTGQYVVLDGSASQHTDPNGKIVSYAWKQTSGPKVTLLDADQPKASFTAPAVAKKGTLRFSLKITDQKGVSDSATASVTVEHGIPAAAEIEEAAFVPTEGTPYAVAVVGKLMHSIIRWNPNFPHPYRGIWQIHDIDDLNQINHIQATQLPSPSPTSVVFDGENKMAYIATGASGFDIYSFSNPNSIKASHGISYEDVGLIVPASKNIIFASSRIEGIHIVDVSSPENPLEIATIPCPDRLQYPYCLFGYTKSGLIFSTPRGANFTEVFDVTNPASPVYLTTLHGYKYAGISKGNISYFIDEGNIINAFDFSNPNSPANIGTINISHHGNFSEYPMNFNWIIIQDNYCISVTSSDTHSTVELYYINSPTDFQSLGSHVIDRVSGKVLLHGNSIFLPQQTGIRVLQFSAVYGGTISPATKSLPFAQQCTGKLLAAASNHGLIATFSTPSRWLANKSYASTMLSSLYWCVTSTPRSRRPEATTFISRRMRSLPPGHSAVLIL